MQDSRQLGILFVSAFVLVGLMVLMSSVLPEEDYRDLAGAEFLVS